MTDAPRILGGRYELGDLLGRGGMAEVRRATDTRLGRQVAVKQLRVDLATDETFQARFEKEAKAAAGLNHHNIVAVYDTGREADPASPDVSVPFIVMELVQGQTLREILRGGRKIVPDKALEIMQGVLDALSYSHKAGIVHRDIKPANVMLTRTGAVKVMDFGIARAVSDTSATMTQTAAVIGTAQYLSPEQARGEVVDSRSDIYSAGCLMYELLTGQPPFSGDSPVSVAYQHVREMPVPPSQVDSLVTPAMDAIVMKSLAKKPADRYQSATEMRADIAAALQGKALMAPPVITDVPASNDIAPTALITPAGAASLGVAGAGTAAAIPATETTAARTTEPVPGMPARAVEAPRKRKPRGSTIALAILAALVIAALVTAGLIIFTPQKADTVAVPPVLNFAPQVAEQAIKDVGLVARIERVSGPDDPSVNTVIKQDPVGNTQVEKGSTVIITVNIGPDKATIPSGLTGKDADEVVALLKKNGFPNVTKEPDTTEPLDYHANQVTRTNPAEGADVTPETDITVYYATGKSKVPNLYGRTLDEASKDLEAAGFRSFSSEDKISATAKPGTVIEQVPAPGELIDRTTRIQIYLAKAPETPTQPPTSQQPTTGPSTNAPPSESQTTPAPTQT